MNTNTKTAAIVSLALVGCVGVGVTAASAAAPSKGTGTVTAALTSPVTISGSAATPMSCVSKGKVYSVTIAQTSIDGGTVAANATVRGYDGPGSYHARVTVTALKDGVGFVAGSVAEVPVEITSTGGSFHFERSASGDRAPRAEGAIVAGSLAWKCPA